MRPTDHYGGSSYRVFARNSGMFYLQATHESNEMMKRLARRMEREGTWDQTAYNEVRATFGGSNPQLAIPFCRPLPATTILACR